MYIYVDRNLYIIFSSFFQDEKYISVIWNLKTWNNILQN